MTIVTIEERILMIKSVQKSRSSLLFSLAADPMLKNTVGPAPVLHKQLRLKVSVCIG